MSSADGLPSSSNPSPRQHVLARVQAACARAGRDPSSVRVLAVSKLQPIEKITALFAEGQREFGENYVQELVGKMEALRGRDLEWHLIGHLQRNKVKFISGRCALLHSVDSLALAEALSRKAAESGFVEKILLQVNVGAESSKEGFSEGDLRRDFAAIQRLPALEVRGLMTMPPLQNEPEQNRPYFRGLAELRMALASLSPRPMPELSMGTSHDFEVAIEEGATIVRVGTVLFGARPHSS